MRDRYVEAFEHFLVAALFPQFGKTAHGGAVRYLDAGPFFQCEFGGRLDDQRVGGHGLVRSCRGEKIGLDQHPGADVDGRPLAGSQHLENDGPKHLVVVSRLSDMDGGHACGALWKTAKLRQ